MAEETPPAQESISIDPALMDDLSTNNKPGAKPAKRGVDQATQTPHLLPLFAMIHALSAKGVTASIWKNGPEIVEAMVKELQALSNDPGKRSPAQVMGGAGHGRGRGEENALEVITVKEEINSDDAETDEEIENDNENDGDGDGDLKVKAEVSEDDECVRSEDSDDDEPSESEQSAILETLRRVKGKGAADRRRRRHRVKAVSKKQEYNSGATTHKFPAVTQKERDMVIRYYKKYNVKSSSLLQVYWRIRLPWLPPRSIRKHVNKKTPPAVFWRFLVILAQAHDEGKLRLAGPHREAFEAGRRRL
ncbi:hypothetical protein B0T16DRAFT_488896 [Cercophora newfieldiana]|uniref:Uncharacterized protein n=1 Tax=Cercophora newfieldiana TaxID=92897 RepID=A0AA39YUQ2_9PEZI|nr:hypothetical protein B0T16DRAFT_488896 [Cercophora newfieldiana]